MMFPIRNIQGQIVGFGGRQFTLEEVRRELPPALSGRVTVVLSHLCQTGEILKRKLKDGCRVFQLEAAQTVKF